MTRSCAECIHGLRWSGAVYCQRPGLAGDAHAMVRSSECQRVYGSLLSRLAGTCGRRGRYFAPREPREPVGLVSAWHAECGSCGHVGPVVIGAGDCWACAACGSEHIREART